MENCLHLDLDGLQGVLQESAGGKCRVVTAVEVLWNVKYNSRK